jgi:hypothetical protein
MATQSTIINIVAESRNATDEPVRAQMQSVEWKQLPDCLRLRRQLPKIVFRFES